MWSNTLIILLAFIAQVHAKELVVAGNDYMDKFVDQLANKLFGRMLKASTLHHTTLGQLGGHAIQPLTPRRPHSLLTQDSTSPQTISKLQSCISALPRHHVEAIKRFPSSTRLGTRSAPRRSSIPMATPTDDVEEATKKYGLEVGLFKAFQNKDGDVKPGDLLKKYGSAYLATSISLAIVSYATCYALISAGVDVDALLSKVGIEATKTSSTAGTAAIAYAVHKAASPIRFPPTVALTPVVAGWLGKKMEGGEEGAETK